MRRAWQGLFASVLVFVGCRSFVGFRDYPDEEDGGIDAAAPDAPLDNAVVPDNDVDVDAGGSFDAAFVDDSGITKFRFTSSPASSFTLPADCVKVHAKLWGAGGGTSLHGVSGGAGGFVYAEWWRTTAGNVPNVEIVVGTAGGAPDGGVPLGGSGGRSTGGAPTAAGGGGGVTRLTHGDVVLVAGAGGGGCAVAGGVGGAGGGDASQAGVATYPEGGVGGAGGNTAGGETTNRGGDGHDFDGIDYAPAGGGGAGYRGGAEGVGATGYCYGGGGGSSFFGRVFDGTQTGVSGSTESGDHEKPGGGADPDYDKVSGRPAKDGCVVVWCTSQ